MIGASILLGCGDEPSVPRAEGIYGPLGAPLPIATEEQRATFERGEAVALRRFSEADGLGPHFNVTFCAGCHEKPVFGGAGARYRSFLLEGQRTAGGARVELGVPSNGANTGVLPQYDLEDGRRASHEDANHHALRNPIPFFGVGLIAEIDEAEILRLQDPNDADGDGITGRANYDGGFVGRFGRKAQTVSIEGFIRGPLFNHLGITSDPLPDRLRDRLPVPSRSEVRGATGGLRRSDGIGGVGHAQAAAPGVSITDDDGIEDPELSEQELFDLVSWAMLLAAPEADPPTPRTEAGEAHFEAIGCASCHVPALRSPRGMVPLYSDLLLHDMGPELADGIEMNRAEGSEFRTQPLWGITAASPYLHDGRADTLEEAILFHGGEGSGAKERFEALSEAAKGELIAFLESLGGAEQRSDGLLPPNAELGEVGSLGGPREVLVGAPAELFRQGRALFDRDVPISEGLGPNFNGDSCRACHFDPLVDGRPTVGGSGPVGVDVTRHGIVRPDGSFAVPARGTMAHRHATDARRPFFDDEANVIELRQTPTVLGMGLIDLIPEAMIRDGADPDDADMDGISGRVHELPDGRVGRFGWKANVPSTEEFVRDAMFHEVGLTLPPQPGLTFGASVDDDGVPDPEMTVPELEAVTFFLNQLAAPPRQSLDETAEAAGEQVFSEVGCVSCHRNFVLDDGTEVLAFSDLLLHDIAPVGFQGIVDGEATQREFRTAPLWGAGRSGSYLHDGRAFSLEEAIAHHEGEANEVRMAYEALDAERRSQLLAFLRSL